MEVELNPIEEEIAAIAVSVQPEYSGGALVGLSYASILDTVRWAGYDPSSVVPLLVRAGAMMAMQEDDLRLEIVGSTTAPADEIAAKLIAAFGGME